MIVNFVIMQTAPGDPVDFLVSGLEAVPEGYLDLVKAKYGYDKPMHEQLFIYMIKLLQGDFGFSFYFHQPVLNVLIPALKNTLILTLASFLIELTGIVLGVIASKKVYSLTDNLITVLTLVTFNMPYFWLAMMFLLIFGLRLGWFPITGMYTIGTIGTQKLISVLWHLALPAVCLSIGRIALYTRYTRASMLEILKLDYITTAWAKGCDEQTVMYNHAFRNALIPIVTVVALRLRTLFTGAVLVESVFAWPGMGRLVFDSISRRDYNIIMANFLIISVITILSNLLADILYAYVDPRVRYND
jgi:peptide/nickel transport system permease protein